MLFHYITFFISNKNLLTKCNNDKKKTYFHLSGILEKKKNLRPPILMNTQLKISSPTNLIVYALPVYPHSQNYQLYDP